MNGISFGHPWVLALLVLPPLLFAAWAWGARRRQRKLRELSREASGATGLLPVALTCLAVALLIFAAALPRWGTRQSEVPREGAEVVFVLDISRSMAAQDVQPSRIAAARDAIVASLDRLGGDRVGLVIFAGNARLRFPLTSDFAAAAQVVRSLETGAVIVEGGTSASQGLDIALSAFDESDAGAGHLIVLITDGNDLGDDPAPVAARVRQAGAELLVAGVGTPEGSTIPVFDRSSQETIEKLDADGQPIVSRLDEAFLRNIAAEAGGQYLGTDLGALPGAVDGRVAALKSALFDRSDTRLPIERFQLFASSALALLFVAAVEEYLPRLYCRRAAVAATAGAALLLLSACATEAYTLNEDGRQAMRANDFQQAIDFFQRAQVQEPDNVDITLNLASAQHAAGQFDEAARTARRAIGAATAEQRARAHSSIGHHRFALGDLPGAADAFRSALLEEPGNDTARHDYEVVLRLMSGEQQQQPGGEDSSSTPEPGGPTPGDPGSPGDAPPDGSPTPAEGEPGSEQQQGQPGSPSEIQQRLQELDAAIARLTEEAPEDRSPAEAQRILDLIAERARITAMRDALSGGGDPNDY